MGEKKDEQRVLEDDEPEVKYRGIKAMPFIIGTMHNHLLLFFNFV